ncbi:MAG: hypothetical protein QOH61_322 [Chloroflexota bacterium]|jgi:hypothetical protein|nr:hypothetical protein [Chloroflexota bacterium]
MSDPQHPESPTASFLVERYWPGVTRPALDAAVDRVRHALPGTSGDGTPVTHVATLLLERDEVVFCIFGATSREAVEALNRRAEFPFDRIVQGTWLSWERADDRARRSSKRRGGTRSKVAGLVAAGALFLAACAGGAPQSSVPGAAGGSATASTGSTASPAPTSAGSQAGADQCSYLTTPEIETATGLEVAQSGPDARGISRCIWTLSAEGLNEIGLSVHLNSERAKQDQDFECNEGFGLKPLAGVGDSACASTVTGGEYLLSALRGDDRVLLRISSDLNNHVKNAAWAALAQSVLAKL